MFSQAIIDSQTTPRMPLEAPVSDSKEREGVGYANLPHPLKEGTVVRCVAVRAGWTRHVVGNDYIIGSNGTFNDERGSPVPKWWGKADHAPTRFIVVDEELEGSTYDELHPTFVEGMVLECVKGFREGDFFTKGNLYTVFYSDIHETLSLKDDEGVEVGDSTWCPARFITALAPVVETKPAHMFTVGDKVRMVDEFEKARAANWYHGIARKGGVYTIAIDHGQSVTLEGDGAYMLRKSHLELVEDTPKSITVDLESEPLFGFTTDKPLFEEVEPVKRDSSQFCWDELTDEEKAELLLAHHEGKRIQHYREHSDEWITSPKPHWLSTLRYRVFTPEMEEAERKEETRKKINDLRSEIADLEATIH